MSELMKKNAEVQNLLEEVEDIAISDVSGAGWVTDLRGIIRATSDGRCGAFPTISAECWKSHKPCIRMPY